MRRWPLLRNRDFMLLWGGEMLSELGSQVSTVAYPLLILSLTGSATEAGIVGLVKWLPVTVFALPAGVLADHVDRKHLMIVCDLVRMGGAASVVVALALGRPAFAQIMIVAFLDGTLFVCSFITERGALSHVVEPAQSHDAVTQNEARTFAASVVGPSLGGVLFAVARALPFAADGMSFLTSTVSLAATRSRFQGDRPARAGATWRSLAAGIADGFAWLRSHSFFGTCALLFAAGNPVFTGVYLLAILLARHHGASPATIGGMLAIVGAGGVLGALAAPAIRHRLTPRAVVVCAEWLLAAAVLGLLFARAAIAIGLLVAVAEFATPVTNAVVSGARIAATPDALQGRVQAASTMTAMSLGWLGPLAVGALFEHAGTTATVSAVLAWSLALAVAATTAPALRASPPA